MTETSAQGIYELVYPISRQIVQKQGYIQKIIDFESDNSQTREQFSIIRDYIQFYLSR